MFTQKTKSDYVLEFVRILPKAKMNRVSLYIFPPAEAEHFAATFDNSEWNARPIDLRYRVIGVSEDKKQAAEQTVSLLSPHYETLRSTWMANLHSSIEKIHSQVQQSGLQEQSVTRFIWLCRGFAKRLRTQVSEEPRQKRYQRQLDVYFSWFAEQNILLLMQHENWADLPLALQQEVNDYLQQETAYRAEQGYLKELTTRPARVFYRMQLYRRFIDRFILLKAEVTSLGNYVRRGIKALITMLIMSMFTLFIFYYRDAYTLSLGLILTVALVYALRDLMRDDLIKFLTDKVLYNKPVWRLRYKKNQAAAPLFQQYLWRSLVGFELVPDKVKNNSGKWFFNTDKNIFLFRSLVEVLDYGATEENIEESLEVDFRTLTDLLSSSKTPVYQYNPEAEQPISTEYIEQRHYYNLVILTEDLKGDTPDQVQRWKLTLTAEGVVWCEAARVID